MIASLGWYWNPAHTEWAVLYIVGLWVLYIAILAVVVAFVYAFWLLFVKGNGRPARGSDLTELRQAENKVKVADPILCRDIDILELYGSDALPDAIELRRAQIQRGDHPDSPSSSRPPL